MSAGAGNLASPKLHMCRKRLAKFLDRAGAGNLASPKLHMCRKRLAKFSLAATLFVTFGHMGPKPTNKVGVPSTEPLPSGARP